MRLLSLAEDIDVGAVLLKVDHPMTGHHRHLQVVGRENENQRPNSCTARSYRGSDILIKPEQIRWIVLVLQFDQPVVVRSKCLPFPARAFCNKVDVRLAGRMHYKRLEAFVHPRDSRIVLRWIFPSSAGGYYKR